MAINKLTDKAVKSAQPQVRPFKLSDGAGMFLFVNVNGSKSWRGKYRIKGKEKTYSMGMYPGVSLKAARELWTAAKTSGFEKKPKGKTDGTFETIARDWFKHHTIGNKGRPLSEKHRKEILRSLENHVFPTLGETHVSDITALDVSDLLTGLATSKPETSSRLLQRLRAIFERAIDGELIENNPVRPSLVRKIKKSKPEPIPQAMLPVEELEEFKKKLEKYEGDPETILAVKLTIYSMCRTSEVIGARWSEFDLDDGVWEIPAERMKARYAHKVFLSKQIKAVLKDLGKLTGHSPFLFPGGKAGTTMSNNTMLFALYRMGYHSRATMHGFRAMASTVLNESNNFSADAIEMSLAHQDKDKIRAAYNRSERAEERRKLIQWWCNWLDKK